jgi:hypothetical protein
LAKQRHFHGCECGAIETVTHDRVMMIWQTLLKSGFDQLAATGADYLDWKQQSHSFENMSTAFAIPEYGLNISGSGEPERVTAAMCSKEFLPVLRINRVVGRNFLREEDSPAERRQ